MFEFLETPLALGVITYALLEIIKDAFDASISCRASSCWLDGYCYVEVPVVHSSSSGSIFAVHRHEDSHSVGALALFTANHTGSYCSENAQSSMSKFQVMFSDDICRPLGICAVAIGVGGIMAQFYLARTLEGRDDTLLELIKATEEHQKKAVVWNRWFKIFAILSGVCGTVYGLIFGVILAGRDLGSFLDVILLALITWAFELWGLSLVNVEARGSINHCTVLFGDVDNLPDHIKAARVQVVTKEMRERSSDGTSWKPSLAEMIAFLFLNQPKLPNNDAAGSKPPIEMTTTAPVISDASLGHASHAPDQGGRAGAIAQQNSATV